MPKSQFFKPKKKRKIELTESSYLLVEKEILCIEDIIQIPPVFNNICEHLDYESLLTVRLLSSYFKKLLEGLLTQEKKKFGLNFLNFQFLNDIVPLTAYPKNSFLLENIDDVKIPGINIVKLDKALRDYNNRVDNKQKFIDHYNHMQQTRCQSISVAVILIFFGAVFITLFELLDNSVPTEGLSNIDIITIAFGLASFTPAVVILTYYSFLPILKCCCQNLESKERNNLQQMVEDDVRMEQPVLEV